jgi:Uma2 family endonuclease
MGARQRRRGEPAREPTPPGHVALLIVEVAETSLHRDRRIKGVLYVPAGVAEYWIVNLVEGAVEA